MSLANIRTALATELASVSGVKKVFANTPGKTEPRAPELAECPAILLELRNDPSGNALPLANSLTQYTHHWDLTLFYSPIGVGTMAERENGCDPFIALIRARLNGHNTLSGNCASVQFSNDWRVGNFEYANVGFYGIQMRLDIFENVQETYAA